MHHIFSITFIYTSLLLCGLSGLVTLSLYCSALVPFCDVDGGVEAGAGAAHSAGGPQPGAARQGPGGRTRHLPQEGHRHFRPLQKCGGERSTSVNFSAVFLFTIVFPRRQIKSLSFFSL